MDRRQPDEPTPVSVFDIHADNIAADLSGVLEHLAAIGEGLAEMKEQVDEEGQQTAWKRWVADRHGFDAKTTNFLMALHAELRPDAENSLTKMGLSQMLGALATALRSSFTGSSPRASSKSAPRRRRG